MKSMRPDTRDALSPFQIYCLGAGPNCYYPPHGLVTLTYGEHLEQMHLNHATCPICGLSAVIPDSFADEKPRSRRPQLKEAA